MLVPHSALDGGVCAAPEECVESLRDRYSLNLTITHPEVEPDGVAGIVNDAEPVTGRRNRTTGGQDQERESGETGKSGRTGKSKHAEICSH